MKTKTLFYMALMAVMMTIAACSQDDELMDAAPKATQIEFKITDGGFADVQTRAVEDGYSTKFTANDKCGLYVVKSDGTFAAENVKLTAEEGENGITWKVADGAISGAADGDKCFLYYPYQSTGMKTKINQEATDSDDAFFASLINDWSVDPNQNDYNLYTWSDLMTAASEVKNEGGKLKVSFSLNHKMTLAIIEVPKTKYKFTNVPDGAEYIVPTLVDFSGYTKPLRMADGTYRFIVNTKNIEPMADCIKGTVPDGKKFTINFGPNLSDCAGGKCKRLKVGGGADGTPIEKDYTLQVGDYLLKDGNLIKQDALTEKQKADVSAIVFSVGHNQYDNSVYTSTGIGAEKCHGYAVALENATYDCKWGKTGTSLGCYPTDGEGNAQSNSSEEGSQKDWSGYLYTQNIKKAAGTLGTSVDGYPATYYAVNYSAAAPACSSGWFLPAVSQLRKVCENKSTLFTNNVGTSTGSWYWSSSEHYKNPADYALYVISSTNAAQMGDKDNSQSVRAILAF